MNQVHKENLTSVDNSLPNRQGLEVEIFGMEGIPEDVAQAHNQRIIAGFYEAEAQRRAATGNPGPGASGTGGQAKKPKFESPADLKKRLAEHKARKAEQAAAGESSGGNTPMDNSHNSPIGQSPGAYVSICYPSVVPLANDERRMDRLSRLHKRPTAVLQVRVMALSLKHHQPLTNHMPKLPPFLVRLVRNSYHSNHHLSHIRHHNHSHQAATQRLKLLRLHTIRTRLTHHRLILRCQIARLVYLQPQVCHSDRHLARLKLPHIRCSRCIKLRHKVVGLVMEMGGKDMIRIQLCHQLILTLLVSMGIIRLTLLRWMTW